ncbi:hypothetical protein [Halosolutus gelatinilyticus]|uniref:hypothetical protein n=1 Tax=Halosolutus gelatinilyticus TaxID=2931975 RepID=UPI001FF2D5B2|nr:hypothetical protein [Halosolutus gelatinilyticus]
MALHRRNYYRVTSDALLPGTTVRYHYRGGSSLATVTDRSDRYVTFVGPDCDGTFTHDQIERLFADDRLQIVLGDARRPNGDERERRS